METKVTITTITRQTLRSALEGAWHDGYAFGLAHGRDQATMQERHYHDGISRGASYCESAIERIEPATPPASAP